MNAIEAVEAAIRLVHENEALAEYNGECSHEKISVAEDAMGLTFPPSYRRFIEEFGTCDFGSASFLGVYEVEGKLWGSHGETLKRRAEGLPDHVIELEEDGTGGILVLDASQPDTDGEYPVRIWEQWRTEMEFLSPNFGAYVLETFQDIVDDDEDED
ncbi:SMI1/KNR4 family protein [Streptomyces chrestomyceticus]|uniref:SMI1/KNR4 family protein n=1 Tax=Streptomyces chrestomyceticus TaxID=68185 RepID=A0ABU7X663_9ACTN